MIIFQGDYIKTKFGKKYHKVVDIVDSMTVKLENGRKVRADEMNISNVLSALEYDSLMIIERARNSLK